MAGGILSTAASGLQVFQRGISVAGHNISNANTEGYSRQRLDLATRSPTVTGQGYLGNGVTIQSVDRMFDEFAVENLRNTTSTSSQFQTYAQYAERVTNLVADSDAGVSAGLESFFNATQEVADDPASIPARQLMLSEAESLVERFHSIDNQLDTINREVNGNISSVVDEINGLSAEIAQLNKSIVDTTSAASGNLPNDLLDRRDTMINRLAELVSVRTVEQENGALNVFIGSGQSLVTQYLASPLQAVNNEFDSSRPEIAISSAGGASVITSALNGGELGALLNLRDQIVTPAQNSLGRIAITLASEFNQQHNLGMDLDGLAGTDLFSISTPAVAANNTNTGTATIAASLDSANTDDLTTEDYIMSFNGGAWSIARASDGQAVTMTGSGSAADPFLVDGMSIEVSGAAANGDRFQLRPTRGGSDGIDVLISSPREIAAAAMAGSPAPGDNSNALLLAGLQSANTMENGATNIQGAYGQLIGKLGTQTRSAQITAEAQGALLTQAQETRDALSGVNLDEEAANLLRFQQAYQAIAQVISVADSTFQTLLNAVGR